jgi:gamma-glutamylcyclotransferase
MSTDSTFLNFAYGSSMLTRRLRERVPSANSIAVATLVGYKLRWHKVSKDHSGKCDVVQTENPRDKVVGVVYEILNSEKASLDSAEGLGIWFNI